MAADYARQVAGLQRGTEAAAPDPNIQPGEVGDFLQTFAGSNLQGNVVRWGPISAAGPSGASSLLVVNEAVASSATSAMIPLWIQSSAGLGSANSVLALPEFSGTAPPPMSFDSQSGVFSLVASLNMPILGTAPAALISSGGNVASVFGSAGQVLRYQASSSAPSLLPTFTTQTVNVQVVKYGTTSYSPTPEMAYCIVEVLGGGGGGGGTSTTNLNSYSASSGGGAGAYVKALFSAAQIANLLASGKVSLSIGAGGSGGSGGVPGSMGNSGGTSWFGTSSIISCPGGNPGNYGPAGPSGFSDPSAASSPPSLATSGFVSICSFVGGSSAAGFFIHSSRVAVSTSGGDSLLGTGGQLTIFPTFGTTSTEQAAYVLQASGSGYGSGGSGTSISTLSSGLQGGNGANGVIIITEFII